jgi:hypothetical protein
MTYEQALEHVKRCESAGICYLCGFTSPNHRHDCLSDSAVSRRGYKFVTELPGDPWVNMFTEVFRGALTGIAEVVR